MDSSFDFTPFNSVAKKDKSTERSFDERLEEINKDFEKLTTGIKEYEAIMNMMRDMVKTENDNLLTSLKLLTMMLNKQKDDAAKECVETLSESMGCRDTSLELNAYRNRQARIFENKLKHNFNTTNVYQEARYILEETAELMRAIEKNDMDNLLEELADIVIFAYGCAAVARVGDLDAKIFEKMLINESREYTKNSDGDFIKKS